MGNTILAHALFSCGQIDIDLDNFFSSSGDAHAIYKLNKSKLIAHHLIERPDSSLTCLIQVVCYSWWEILRIKLSYSKWYKTVPTLDNATTFFPNPPVLQTDKNMVEWWSITYYDMLCALADTVPHSKVLFLSDYIQGNLSSLIDSCESVMKWTWNHDRSQQFYNKMLLVNQGYFDWLDKIKTAVTARPVHNLDLWEQALAIAKWCFDKNQHPRDLYWDSVGCNADTDNLYLNLLRKHYGKTI